MRARLSRPLALGDVSRAVCIVQRFKAQHSCCYLVKVYRGSALTRRRLDRYLPSDSYDADDVTPIGVNTNASEEELRTTTVSS